MSPKLKLDVSLDGTGSSWITLTSWAGKDYLLLSKGISINRGRDDETGDAISPGTMTFVLDNADARFSPGILTSPCYPYLEKPGSLLKLSAWVNGAWVARFYGVAQSWITTLDGDLTGKRAVTTVTATDMLGAFPQYTFRQASDEVVRSTPGILHHWPLTDTQSPALARIGTAQMLDNGASGWASGPALPMDEGDSKHVLINASSGLRLTSSKLRVASPWTVLLVIDSAPTVTNVPVLGGLDFVGASGGVSPVFWSTTSGFYLGAGTSTGLPTAWPVVLAVTSAATVFCVDAAGVLGSGAYGSGSTYGPLGQLRVNMSGYSSGTWSAAHLCVISGVISSGSVASFASKMLATRSALDPVALVSGFAAAPPVSGSSLGTMPNLDGRDAADVLGAIVTGMGARLVDNLDGTLRWVPFAPSSAPVTIPRVTADLSWGTSEIGWCSDCTETEIDGTTYTATRTDGKRQTVSIEGVHANPTLNRSFADWTVSTASLGGRCPTVPVDMMTMTAVQQAALCAVGPGSRISPPTPSYMPSGLVLISEGLAETIDAQNWDITFKASPDVYSRLFILNDSTQGVLDSAYVLAP